MIYHFLVTSEHTAERCSVLAKPQSRLSLRERTFFRGAKDDFLTTHAEHGTERHVSRRGVSMLEVQVALALFVIALSGLYPLVLMQSKQLRKMQTWLQPQTTYYLSPSRTLWAQKLEAAAMLQTQDPGPAPGPPTLLIDNGQNGYSETGPNWTTSTQANAYLGSLRWCPMGTGGNTASWSFTGLSPGWYDVQATWPANSNQADNAPFTFFDGAQNRGTAAVNQQQAPAGSMWNGSTFQSLNKLAIVNTTLTVTLTDNADGRVIADAVRLVPLGNVVTVLSFQRSLLNQSVTANVSVNVQVPP